MTSRFSFTASSSPSLFIILVLPLCFQLAACSSARKKKDQVSLAELENKKVALIEIEGEATSRKVAEVALVNQLVQHGSFILVSKQDVEKAKAHYKQDTTDWVGVARRSGADYALKIDVERFFAETKDGYSREKKYDSQLAEERGEDDAILERLYKVRSLTGAVEYGMEFRSTSDPSVVRSGSTSYEETKTANEKDGAIRLPPRLRFLEELSNKAFAKFFKKYKD